jgi:hypothetical protein|tara:strand:- start:210 stop:536 length:327 start_codon:yes stop_codon:yes gene_type:complete
MSRKYIQIQKFGPRKVLDGLKSVIKSKKSPFFSPKSTFMTKIIIFWLQLTLTGLKYVFLQPKQACNRAFLLQLGYEGLKYPFLAQKVLIGLKKGMFLPILAFLESFLY